MLVVWGVFWIASNPRGSSRNRSIWDREGWSFSDEARHELCAHKLTVKVDMKSEKHHLFRILLEPTLTPILQVPYKNNNIQ